MRLGSLFALASLLLLSTSARAVPLLVSDPGAVVPLVPGSTTTLSFSIAPDAAGVKGFSAFFAISDSASIVLEGCSSLVDPAANCPAGGAAFDFAVLDFTPAETAVFEIGEVTVMVPAGATIGATLSSTTGSSITLGTFDEVFPPATVYAQVVPEPGTFALAGFGLALMGARRRRAAWRSPRP